MNLSKTTYITFIILAVSFLSTISFSAEYDPQNVTSRVNITNAWPEITTVTPEDPINLVKGTTKIVWCNGTAFDFNGWTDITNINASIYHSSSSHYSSDNNNSHYFNDSCTITGSGINADFSCAFEVYYYALNGTWTCNATAIDTFGGTGFLSNTTTVNPLWAINLTPEINFGDMAVGDVSLADEQANVTNLGNRNVTISVEGYGLNPGDGLAMVCEQRNITISNERYSTSTAVDWSLMSPLSESTTDTGLFVPKQTIAGVYSLNTSYWKLYIPPEENPFGLCNGTIVFTAVE